MKFDNLACENFLCSTLVELAHNRLERLYFQTLYLLALSGHDLPGVTAAETLKASTKHALRLSSLK